jgi:hypothetical protein
MNDATLTKSLKNLGIQGGNVSTLLKRKAFVDIVNKAMKMSPSKRQKKGVYIVKRAFGAPNLINTQQHENIFTSRGPKPKRAKYDEGRNRLVRNSEAKKIIRNALSAGITSNILRPVGKKGVNPQYIHVLNRNPITYAYVRKRKNGSNKPRAFAFLRNLMNQKTRYLNVIAGEGYGGRLLNKISSNARANGKRYINLNSVGGPVLHAFYTGAGFRLIGSRRYTKNLTLNASNLALFNKIRGDKNKNVRPNDVAKRYGVTVEQAKRVLSSLHNKFDFLLNKKAPNGELTVEQAKRLLSSLRNKKAPNGASPVKMKRVNANNAQNSNNNNNINFSFLNDTAFYNNRNKNNAQRGFTSEAILSDLENRRPENRVELLTRLLRRHGRNNVNTPEIQQLLRNITNRRGTNNFDNYFKRVEPLAKRLFFRKHS